MKKIILVLALCILSIHFSLGQEMEFVLSDDLNVTLKETPYVIREVGGENSKYIYVLFSDHQNLLLNSPKGVKYVLGAFTKDGLKLVNTYKIKGFEDSAISHEELVKKLYLFNIKILENVVYIIMGPNLMTDQKFYVQSFTIDLHPITEIKEMFVLPRKEAEVTKLDFLVDESKNNSSLVLFTKKTSFKTNEYILQSYLINEKLELQKCPEVKLPYLGPMVANILGYIPSFLNSKSKMCLLDENNFLYLPYSPFIKEEVKQKGKVSSICKIQITTGEYQLLDLKINTKIESCKLEKKDNVLFVCGLSYSVNKEKDFWLFYNSFDVNTNQSIHSYEVGFEVPKLDGFPIKDIGGALWVGLSRVYVKSDGSVLFFVSFFGDAMVNQMFFAHLDAKKNYSWSSRNGFNGHSDSHLVMKERSESVELVCAARRAKIEIAASAAGTKHYLNYYQIPGTNNVKEIEGINSSQTNNSKIKIELDDFWGEDGFVYFFSKTETGSYIGRIIFR